ncbi:hypothetical protein ANCCAN_12724 [Ancylostoma caninum]|uniref:Uncharacterized protein n=1 Tax=Ancylostoma caninum TaxID=29170 RepID=A0A368GAE4_ANCCA|nr:hypothetical protein ANCCAN_12724 [Ancylostoma caninum]
MFGTNYSYNISFFHYRCLLQLHRMSAHPGHLTQQGNPKFC